MDLSTNYLGLQLRNPLVASSSPLTRKLDTLKQLEDAGVGAVVLPSLFEEQLRKDADAVENLLNQGNHSISESEGGFFPDIGEVDTGLGEYLALIETARSTLDIPVIASLNGATDSGWTRYATSLQEAGAQALELNVYILPTDLSLSGRDVEQTYIDILTSVKSEVSIPVAMKLSPYFSAFGSFALQLVAAGADGLTLFNRFYQPDIDVKKREIAPILELSRPSEARLPLLWTGVLCGKTEAYLAATTGVETSEDLIKYLLAGSDVVMTTSSLLRHGPAHARTLLQGVETWLEDHDCTSVSQIRGSMRQGSVSNPGAFERSNYMQILLGYDGIV
jgi:dihydroorotate dehydrogenase (fumarate)